MKVYSADITPPSIYTKSFEELNKEFNDYMDALNQYAIDLGYNGPLTGKIARFGVADGYAIYMYCDGGRDSCLIKSEYADGYNLSHIESINKSAIIKLLKDY